MATIKIPPVLRPSVGGEKEVQASGSDVGALLNQLAEQHPATQSQLFGPDGSLNRYVNVYLNDEDVRVLGGLGTSLGESDGLGILPAMAGGSSAAAKPPGGTTSRRWRTRTPSWTGTSRRAAAPSTGSARGSASPGSAASRAPARRPGGTDGRWCRTASRRGSCPCRPGSRAPWWRP